MVETQQVVQHLHLPAGAYARADANRGDAHLRSDQLRHSCWHHLEHDPKASRRLEGKRGKTSIQLTSLPRSILSMCRDPCPPIVLHAFPALYSLSPFKSPSLPSLPP